MKKILFFIFFSGYVYSNNYNFITLSDEFDSKGKLTLSSSSSLFIKNSYEFFKRNIFNIENEESIYGSEKYHVLSLEQGVRYGFSDSLNILGNIGGSYSHFSSLSSNGNNYSYSNTKFDYINIGFSKRVNNKNSDWNKTIYLLTDVVNYNNKLSFFKNFNIDFIIDKTIDPIVFSFKSGIKYYSRVNNNGNEFKPASEVIFKPRLDFLANQNISISFATEIKIKSSEKYNGRKINVSGIENFISIGSSYNISKDKKVYLESSFDTTGKSGAIIYLNFEKDI